MRKFTEEQVRAYIEAVFSHHGLEIEISGKEVLQSNDAFAFRGKMPKQRRDWVYILPLDTRTLGVYNARSILCGDKLADMRWLVNGQASDHCRDIVFIGGSSDKAISLHWSHEMLRSFTHEPLLIAEEKQRASMEAYCEENYAHYIGTGLYADKVSIGTYVDKGEATLTLELVSAVADAEPIPFSAP